MNDLNFGRGFWVGVFGLGFGLLVLGSGVLGTGFWCQTLCSVGEVWVEQDYANLSDTERRVWVGRIERICVKPGGKFG